MWRDRTVGVIIPTYRERATVRAVVEGFQQLGIADEIVVVNNNAEPGTREEVARTTAREVYEADQGYGAAIRRGIAETSSDLICICEADGTFDPADLIKLLAYCDEFEFVFGSRTLRELIWSGANMGHALRWGNWIWAKLVEGAFGTSHLSDIGCTMRVVSGPALRLMQPFFTTSGGAFGPEMLMLSVLGGWRMVQLPVSYHPRGGHRGTTESLGAAGAIAIEMLGLIARYWWHRRRIAAGLERAGAAQTRRQLPTDRRPGGEPTHMFPRIRRHKGDETPQGSDREQVAIRDDS